MYACVVHLHMHVGGGLFLEKGARFSAEEAAGDRRLDRPSVKIQHDLFSHSLALV